MMQAWSAPPAAREQTYSVSCPEGHRLTGLRTEGYQALRCPTCGEGVFVLPRSPLPEPSAPSTGSASSARGRPSPVMTAVDDDPVALRDPSLMPSGVAVEGEEADGEIEWVDESRGPETAPPTYAPGPAAFEAAAADYAPQA